MTTSNNFHSSDGKRIRLLAFIVGLVPLRALYALSDAAFVLMYHIVRYRRHVVRHNLTTSFPEKGDKEIAAIERAFYHWFCDYFVETIKLLNISDAELRRRFTVEGAELVEQCFEQGRDCAALLGHFCNWEWLSCLGMAFPEGRVMGLIYKPLRSAWADRLFRRLRSSQPSGLVVPKQDILRALVKLKREGRRSFFGYIADQGPRYVNIHLWLQFLGHDTGVFTGAERIMRKMNDAVFYLQMSRPKRGCYHVKCIPLAMNPGELPEYELTRRFFQMLEADIRRTPQFYLWSHNRWKRTHEEYNRLKEIQKNNDHNSL